MSKSQVDQCWTEHRRDPVHLWGQRRGSRNPSEPPAMSRLRRSWESLRVVFRKVTQRTQWEQISKNFKVLECTWSNTKYNLTKFELLEVLYEVLETRSTWQPRLQGQWRVNPTGSWNSILLVLNGQLKVNWKSIVSLVGRHLGLQQIAIHSKSSGRNRSATRRGCLLVGAKVGH